MKDILPKDKDFVIFMIAAALIAGFGYFIIQLNSIPNPRFVPQNLDYMPRKR